MSSVGSARPIDVCHLFQPDRDALVGLLRELAPEDWRRPTVCAEWDVRDVALHILGGDLSNISRRRDGEKVATWGPDENKGPFLARVNQEWVATGRRSADEIVAGGATLSVLHGDVSPFEHLDVFIGLRWAVQARYFAWRIRNDVGVGTSSTNNRAGLEDALAALNLESASRADPRGWGGRIIRKDSLGDRDPGSLGNSALSDQQGITRVEAERIRGRSRPHYPRHSRRAPPRA